MAGLLDEGQDPGTADGVVGPDVGHDRELTGERHVAAKEAAKKRLRIIVSKRS